MKERRKYKIFENLTIEKPFVARFQIGSDKAQETKSDDWDEVTLQNLSAGGIFFHYTKDLAIGTLLDLKIYVSRSMLTINCVGKIIRIDKLKSTSMYGIAVKFTEIGEQEKEMIIQQLKKS